MSTRRSRTCSSGSEVVTNRFLSCGLMPALASTDGAFQRHRQQRLGFERELHRQFVDHVLAEAADDQRYRFLRIDAALLAIEQPLFRNARGAGLVLDHRVVARRYREGRIFLVGDAAHMLWPKGGFGANTGIGDAVDLGWKLAAVHAGWGGEALLASYEAERRPIGVRNVAEAASNRAA
ncbi:MAG: FAD-dependent monooxygenase, partial [Comamonadaceae bacterium]|nr:FAD-dependent monooxygenase [Comamonadaceae bacterium]